MPARPPASTMVPVPNFTQSASLVLLLLVAACREPAADGAPPAPSVRGGSGQDEPQDDVVVRLERTACFGLYPVYVVTVHGDGTVEFQGEEHTAVQGRRTKRIAPEAVRELVEEFERIGFQGLAEEYRYETGPDGTVSTVTDFPTRITSITRGGVTKRVENYFGGPPELAALEDRIDAVAGVEEWVGSR